MIRDRKVQSSPKKAAVSAEEASAAVKAVRLEQSIATERRKGAEALERAIAQENAGAPKTFRRGVFTDADYLLEAKIVRAKGQGEVCLQEGWHDDARLVYEELAGLIAQRRPEVVAEIERARGLR